MFERCLICTDFTDGLQRMVKFLPNLGEGGLKEITFLNSVPVWTEGEVPRIDQKKIEEAKKRLSSAFDNVPDNMKVNVEVLSGNAVDNILSTVQKYNVDFIIVGTALSTSLQKMIFGSTTQELINRLKVPMMIFRPQLISVLREDELALRCRNLNRFWLIPYNDYPHHRSLIKRIKAYATDNPVNTLSQCLLLSVVDEVSRSPEITQNNMKEAEKKLSQVKQELESVGVEVATIVRKGSLLEELFDVALENDISAIALGDDQEKSVLNRILDLTVGSRSHYIINSSWFPLIYIPMAKS